MRIEHQEVAVWTKVALAGVDLGTLEFGPAPLPPPLVFLFIQIVDVDVDVAPFTLVEVNPIGIEEPCA